VSFQDLGEARRNATAVSGDEEEVQTLFVGVGGPEGCGGAVLEFAEPGEVDVEGFYCVIVSELRLKAVGIGKQ